MCVVDLKQTRKTNNEATECLGGRTGVDPGFLGEWSLQSDSGIQTFLGCTHICYASQLTVVYRTIN